MIWETLISFDGWTALSWGIIHSLWIGLVVLGLALIGQIWWSGQPKRLSALHSTLLLMLAGSTLATMIGYGWEIQENATLLHTSEKEVLLSASATATDVPVTGFWNRVEIWVQHHQVWIGLSYLFGAFVFMGRALIGYWHTRQLRKAPHLSDQHPMYRQMCSVASKMGITQSIRLIESTALSVPATVGHWQPFIFLPVGLTATLSVREVEAILAHELAHIARHDYLWQWFHQAARTLLFYHPVTYLLLREIDLYREAAADDLATQITQDKTALATALAQVSSSHLVAPTSAVALGDNHKPLLRRIQRLLGHSSSLKTNTMNRSSILLSALLLAGIFVLAAATQTKTPPNLIPASLVVVDTPPPTPPTPPSPPPPPLPPVPSDLDMPQTPVLPTPPAMPADRGDDSMEKWGDAMEEWGEQVGELMEAWGESFGESFQQMEGQWDEDYVEQMRAFGEEMRQWAELYRDEFARNMRHMDREIRILEKEIIEKPDAHQKDAMADQLSTSLQQDGLWQKGESLALELDTETMNVNGVQQSAELHKKYLALVEKIHGQPIAGDFAIHILLD